MCSYLVWIYKTYFKPKCINQYTYINKETCQVLRVITRYRLIYIPFIHVDISYTHTNTIDNNKILQCNQLIEYNDFINIYVTNTNPILYATVGDNHDDVSEYCKALTSISAYDTTITLLRAHKYCNTPEPIKILHPNMKEQIYIN